MLTLWLFLPPPHRELLGKWDDPDLWLRFHFEPSLGFVNVVSAAFPVPNTIPARTILLEWKMFRTATLILNRKPSFQFCSEDRDHTLIDMYHPRCLTLHAQRYIYITNTHGLCFLYNKQDIFCMKLVFFSYWSICYCLSPIWVHKGHFILLNCIYYYLILVHCWWTFNCFCFLLSQTNAAVNILEHISLCLKGNTLIDF